MFTLSSSRLILFLSIIHISTLSAENYNSEHSTQSLGTAFEFKIHVDPGKEDCYYQLIEAGASLYVSFQVMKGGDGNAGFYINDPHGQTIMPYQLKAHAEFDDSQVTTGGYYAFCLDNRGSSYKGRLISFYLASFKRDEWDKYIQELTIEDGITQNTTNHLRNVDMNVNEMMKYLENSKQQHTHDWYVIESNNKYVQNWSILQCIVIVISAVVQVYFVRKLFKINETGKVRA